MDCPQPKTHFPITMARATIVGNFLGNHLDNGGAFLVFSQCFAAGLNAKHNNAVHVKQISQYDPKGHIILRAGNIRNIGRFLPLSRGSVHTVQFETFIELPGLHTVQAGSVRFGVSLKPGPVADGF